MEKLKDSLDIIKPGSTAFRHEAVIREHQRAIDELDSDIIKTKNQVTDVNTETKNRLSKLENRILAFENIWYRRFGRWLISDIWKREKA